MGKRVRGASLKMSKINEKKQLNTLMKVVRPKVYITDSSSFRSLVQELTGNGTAFSCSGPSSLPQKVEKVVPLDSEDHGEQENSIEVSFDASIESVEFCNSQVCSTEVPNQYDDQVFFNGHSDDYLTMSRQADKLACQDIESWLLDLEKYPSYGSYTQVHQEEVSIYDYELAGLL